MSTLRLRLDIGRTGVVRLYWVLVVVAVLYRCAAMVFHGIDTDEFDHVNLAWHGLQGHAYFPSKFGVMPHLYWELLQPVIVVFGERVEALLAVRSLALVASLVTFFLWYRFGRVMYGRSTAWVAPLAFTFVVFSARSGIEARPDVPQMLCYALALPLVATLRLDGPAWRIAAAGFLLGLAGLFKQTGLVLGALLLIPLLWHERACLWPVRVEALRLLARATVLGLAPAVALWLACAFQSGAPGDFLFHTLINVPHLHGEGQVDYSGLWLGMRLNPLAFLVPAIFLIALALQLVRRRGIYHPRGATLGLAVVAYTAVDVASAANYSDSHFLQVAMLTAVTGAYLAGWVHDRAAERAGTVLVAILFAMAANVMAIEPLLSARKAPYERLSEQVATVRFLLEHTPSGTPVLGSYPIWMFRSGGEHINPPELPEAFLIAHTATDLNVDRQVLIDDFTSQPAVFVHMDGWMGEVMSEVPEIDAFVREEYQLWCYPPGKALIGVHRSLGQYVPRHELTPFVASQVDCSRGAPVIR